ncbi:MAG TPA: ABC transporter substrate-binding protein [Ilumatobacter sp.]|nr:ABC transporter substrate-binding protein [Ilumatobacter sp.]
MTSHRRSRPRLARALSISLAAALVVAACGGGDDDESVDDADPTTTVTADEDTGDTDGGDTGDTTGDTTGATTGDTEDDNPDDGSPVVETLPPDTTPDPVKGGTLRYGLEADVDGLNPTVSALTAASGLVIASAVYDTLAAYAADGSVVPYLAESFTPNEDFTQWTVKLRPGVLFHDGTPADAAAFITNFEAQRASGLVGLAVNPFFPAEGATELVDDLTVQVTLLDANAFWPAYMTGQLGMMASPAWLAASLADPTLNQEPVGTGPFVFASRSEDSVTTFVRNEEWWNGAAYLDSIEFLPVPDSATRLDLLVAGDINALHNTDPDTIEAARTDDSLVNILDDSGSESFVMMNSAVAPFDDIRVRQALTFATPKADYLALIGLGVLRSAEQMFIPESPYYNPAVVQEADMVDQAVALATEYCAEVPANCSDGRINMEYQWSGPSVIQTRIADLLIDSWSAAFNVTRDELLQDEHIQQTALGQYNVNTWRQFDSPEASTDNVWLLCRTVGGISLNWPKLCDPARDEALLTAQAVTDPAARAAEYQEAVQLIHDAYVYVFLTHTLWNFAFTSDVRGQCDRVAPDGTPLLCNAAGRTWHDSIWIG